jgi:DNA-binding NarL/FixJ family response regulator
MTSTQKNLRILIIDPADNPALRTSLESQFDMVVSHHTSGRTALDSLRQVKPDVIVLNANLGDLPASSLLAELSAENLILTTITLSVG